MAKRPLLSTGTVKSKRFDFMLDDDDFEEHTREFVPATTAADAQKCIRLFEDCKKSRTLYSPQTKCLQVIYSLTRDSYVNGCANSALKPERKTVRTTLQRQFSIT